MAQEQSYLEELRYRVYVTDALQVIAENSTHFVGVNGMIDYGKSMSVRFLDMLRPQPKEPEEEDNRGCVEIATDIWKKIRGKEEKAEC